MSEQAKLPKGVERYFYRKRMGTVEFYAHPEGNRLQVSDLPAIIAQRDEEWRSGLLGDEAVDAIASMIAKQERWNWRHPDVKTAARTRATGYLKAALDKGAPDGGRGE